jgi:hypothetical protein
MSSPESIPGFVFFSPAMVNPVAGSEVDVSSVTIVAKIVDTYRSPSPPDAIRPFLLGPAPAAPSGRAWPPDFSASYEPALNNTQYGFMSNKPGAAVRGEILNTSTLELEIVLV